MTFHQMLWEALGAGTNFLAKNKAVFSQHLEEQRFQLLFNTKKATRNMVSKVVRLCPLMVQSNVFQCNKQQTTHCSSMIRCL
jgi:hypothetical protein